jgi:NADH:ubiquinone oxidoreductase subunit 5 (subunit L)/multisubunit Na+/H+ antiporter MnhA subunit
MLEGIWGTLIIGAIFLILYFMQYFVTKTALKAAKEGKTEEAKMAMDLVQNMSKIPEQVAGIIGKPFTGIAQVINTLATTAVASTNQTFKAELENIKEMGNNEALDYLHLRMKTNAMNALELALQKENITIDDGTKKLMDVAIEGAVSILKSFRKPDIDIVTIPIKQLISGSETGKD